MTDTQLMKLIGKSTGVEYSGLSMASRLAEDAQFDSLSILMFLVLLETEYGLHLSVPRGVSLSQMTVGDLYRIISDAEAIGKGSDEV